MRPHGSFLLIGNTISVDFVNTESMRDGAIVDSLQSEGDLLRWARAAGLEVDLARAKAGSRGELAPEVRELRAALRRLFEACIQAQRPSASDLSRVNTFLTAPAPAPPLWYRSGQFGRGSRAIGDRHGVLARVAEDAAAVLTGAERGALRRCAGEHCVLLFLDRSRAGGRRWCSMDVCGNRSKVAAHYKRTKT